MHNVSLTTCVDDGVCQSCNSTPIEAMQEARHNSNSQKLRAFLMTEGAPVNARIVNALTEHGCDITTPASASEALGLLQQGGADVIVLDNVSPGCGTVGVVHHLRDTGTLEPSVPVVAVAYELSTASEREQLLESGIWDVLASPLKDAELRVRLINFLPVRRTFLEAQEASLTDPVTGLYSRRGLSSRVTELAGQCARQGAPLSCVAFALNVVSDGRPTALTDVQLAEVSAGLKRVGRASDVIGFEPASDFVLLAPGANGDNARHIAQRLSRSISSLLNSHGVACDVPWAGRVLQPSKGGEKLGRDLLRDTLLALRDATSDTRDPALFAPGTGTIGGTTTETPASF